MPLHATSNAPRYKTALHIAGADVARRRQESSGISPIYLGCRSPVSAFANWDGSARGARAFPIPSVSLPDCLRELKRATHGPRRPVQYSFAYLAAWRDRTILVCAAP